MNYAPIALFIYKRLWHTQQTVLSLQNNPLAIDSELFIYSDGPKDHTVMKEVHEVRAWAKEITGFKKVYLIEKEKNDGLAKSIIQGVTDLLHQYQKIIVVEDDLIVSPFFLNYMNEGLKLYEHEGQVASIHGFAFPLQDKMPQSYFVRGSDCWGWATWKRAWDRFEPDGKKLLSILKTQKLFYLFDYEGTYLYSKMLKDQIAGKNNSWAIRWHASAFIHNMLTLYPGKSLVKNIGLDNTGEHCQENSTLQVEISNEAIELKRIPVREESSTRQSFIRFFKSTQESIYKKIVRKAKRLMTMS